MEPANVLMVIMGVIAAGCFVAAGSAVVYQKLLRL